MQESKETALDLAWGVKEIANMIGRNERQTYHLCSTGAIPVRKVGAHYVADRGKLRRLFLEDAAN
jgi:hypothetical protein